MTENQKRSLALLCDPHGLITQVLRNDLPLPAAIPGHLFVRLVEPASQFKALSFLDEIRTHTVATHYALSLPLSAGVETVYFSGGLVGAQLLIVGAANEPSAAPFYDAMLHISNEQANLLRAALKENSAPRQAPPVESAYDEISRLNNELISMQRTLTQQNAELARLNALKNQFVGMAAHDLRNPLAAIQAYSELLRDTELSISPAERTEWLTTISTLSEFMSNMVNDLLSVSAIESGQLVLDRQTTDLAALLHKKITQHRLLAAPKHIEITLDLSPTPPIWLDALKIEQVVDNLLGNAVKFSPLGTQVYVRLRHNATQVIIEVQDHGPGIPPAEMDRLFKPFGRTSAQTTGGERSTGLGLVIVKRIVEGHGGHIGLTSEVGHGTTFCVTFPLPAPSSAP